MNKKKFCSFYVSEYHLLTILLPYLDKQIKNVEILKQASEGIFKTVSSYAQNTQQISSKAVDATIGSSYQGYDVKSGYQSAGRDDLCCGRKS